MLPSKINWTLQSSLLLCAIAYNTSTKAGSHFELMLEGGPSWVKTGSTHVAVTDIETDLLYHKKTLTVGEVDVGAAYVLPLLTATDESFRWLTQLHLGLMLRFSGFAEKITRGGVQQFSQSNLDNYHYHLYFDNTRLLAQAMVDVFNMGNYSVIAQGGLGEAWSQLRYKDYPNAGVQLGNLSLKKHNQSGFVGEVGVGLHFNYSQHLTYSVKYLATFYENIKPSHIGQLNGEPVNLVPPSFSANAQAVLFGFLYQI